MKLSRVITIDRNDIHAKSQSQKSTVKVTGAKTNFPRIRSFPDFYAWSIEVRYYFSRPFVKFQGRMGQKIPNFTRIERFRTVTPVLIQQWPQNEAHTLK